MGRTPAEVAEQARRLLDPAFHGLGPLLDGMAGAMAMAEAFADDAVTVATVTGAEAGALRLIAEGEGVTPLPGESDESLRQRIRLGVRTNSIHALRELVRTYLGDSVPHAVVEGPDARIYCDDDATEYVTDFFCDEGHLLGEARTIFVVIDDGLGDDVELGLCAVLDRWRPVGIRILIIIETGLAVRIVAGLPWAEPT